jgi:hypothetical protein
MDNILKKYKKGERLLINPKYIESIRVKDSEKRLPAHIQDKIRISRRRHVQKLGIKRIFESEKYVRIKYVRYVDDFLLGVKGSLKLTNKICDLIDNFLKSNLHVSLNREKTRIVNTYGDKVSFLNMFIYNVKSEDFSYKNSREIENQKRVKRRKIIKKKLAFLKILKNTKENMIKFINTFCKVDKQYIVNIFKYCKNSIYKVKIKELLKKRIRSGVFKKGLDRVEEGFIVKSLLLKSVCLDKVDVIISIYSSFLKKIIVIKDRVLLDKLKEFFIAATRVTPYFLSKEKTEKFNYCKLGSSKIKISRGALLYPLIILDRKKIYDRLVSASIMNSKKNPCAKMNLVTASAYNIIQYFNELAFSLLSYYRCVDDFYKIKNIVK